MSPVWPGSLSSHTAMGKACRWEACHWERSICGESSRPHRAGLSMGSALTVALMRTARPGEACACCSNHWLMGSSLNR